MGLPTAADFAREASETKLPTAEDFAREEQESGPNKSKLESALRGGAQGLTLGYSDEAVGGLQSLYDAAKNGTFDDFLENYKKHRDESREENTEAEESNPLTYSASELAGNIAGTIAVPGGGSLLGAAKVGAALGGVNTVGKSNAELGTDTLKDAAIGAAAGGLGGSVGYGIGKGVDKVTKYVGETAANIRDLAHARAFKALGGERSAAANLRKSGRDAKELGEFALEKHTVPKENSLGEKLPGEFEDVSILTPLGSDASMAQNAQRISDHYNNVLDVIYEGGNDLTKVNPLVIMQKIKDLRDPNAVIGTAQAAANKQLDKMLNIINNYGTKLKDGEYLPIADARKLMQDISDNTNFKEMTDAAANLKNDIGQKSRRAVRDEVSDTLKARDDEVANNLQPGETLEDVGAIPPIADTFEFANNKVANSIDAQKLLNIQGDKDTGNNFFGLGNTIVGAAAGGGALAGGPVGAALAAGGGIALKKALEKYGPQLSAIGLKKLGESKLLQKVNPTNIAPGVGKVGSLLGREAVPGSDVDYDVKISKMDEYITKLQSEPQNAETGRKITEAQFLKHVYQSRAENGSANGTTMINPVGETSFVPSIDHDNALAAGYQEIPEDETSPSYQIPNNVDEELDHEKPLAINLHILNNTRPDFRKKAKEDSKY